MGVTASTAPRWIAIAQLKSFAPWRSGAPTSEDGPQRVTGLDDAGDAQLDGVEQRVLVEEVVARVGAQPELGEHREHGAAVMGALGELEGALGVVGGVGDPHSRDAGGDPREPVGVQRVERRPNRIRVHAPLSYPGTPPVVTVGGGWHPWGSLAGTTAAEGAVVASRRIPSLRVTGVRSRQGTFAVRSGGGRGREQPDTA